MTRLLVIVFVAGFVGLAAMWTASHDGPLSIVASGYEIQTTVAVGVITVLLLFVLVWAVLRALFGVVKLLTRSVGGTPSSRPSPTPSAVRQGSNHSP